MYALLVTMGVADDSEKDGGKKEEEEKKSETKFSGEVWRQTSLTTGGHAISDNEDQYSGYSVKSAPDFR